MKNMLSSVDCQRLITIIDVLEAYRWIPQEFKKYAFFGADDQWLYVKSGNPHLCEDCEGYDGTIFSGDELRSEFPYLRIIDQNAINPNVHPHCECLLIRLENQN